MYLPGYQRSNSLTNIANGVSVICHTPFIAIPIFLIISYYSSNDFLIIGSISVIFGGLLPLIITYLYAKEKNIDIDIPTKEDRIYPLLLVLPSYLIGFTLLYFLGSPTIITILMFCYFSIAIIVILISLYWKISLHTMGIAGPAVFLIYIFGFPGLIFSLVLPLVMWSRVYLGRHTISQVVIGAFLGVLLTSAQIYFLLN